MNGVITQFSNKSWGVIVDNGDGTKSLVELQPEDVMRLAGSGQLIEDVYCTDLIDTRKKPTLAHVVNLYHQLSTNDQQKFLDTVCLKPYLH